MPLVNTAKIYELVISGVQSGGAFNHVLHYINDGLSTSDPGSVVLVNEWVSQVSADYVALVSSTVQIDTLSCRRLNNITDFKETPVTLTGAIGGDRTPRFTAWRIDKVRATKETRSGSIRIPGVTEADTLTSGSQLTVAALARLTTLAGTLGNNIIQGGDAFQMVIVGNKYDTTQDPPVLKAEGLWSYNRISALSAIGAVTSQVSRK